MATKRFAVVTGATSGFGRAAADHLAAKGFDLCLISRDADRLATTAAEFSTEHSGRSVQTLACDLSSICDTDRLGEEIAGLGRPIDLLLNNAGAVRGPRRQVSVDGIEATMALNHFGYVALTRRLLDRVASADPGRIVNVASDAYGFAKGRFDFDDWSGERRYRPHRQYGRSKLANILFTRELARRVDPSAVQVAAWSPKGLTATRFAYGAHRFAPLAMKLTHPFAMPTAKAVVTLNDLCTRPFEPDDHGAFFHADMVDPVDVAPPEDAARLWELTETIIGDALG